MTARGRGPRGRARSSVRRQLPDSSDVEHDVNGVQSAQSGCARRSRRSNLVAYVLGASPSTSCSRARLRAAAHRSGGLEGEKGGGVRAVPGERVRARASTHG